MSTQTPGWPRLPFTRYGYAHPAGGVAERLNAPVLKTGNGRQGHSWVRIPPPPLREPNSAWLSAVGAIVVAVRDSPFSPSESAGVRCLYTWGAQWGRRPWGSSRPRLHRRSGPLSSTRWLDRQSKAAETPALAPNRVGPPQPPNKRSRRSFPCARSGVNERWGRLLEGSR